MHHLISRLRELKVLPSLILLSGLLPIFLLRAPWDPDPHHDGVMYAAAIGVRDGLLPNRDVFAQYGPLIPAIQGLWLKLFGPALLNLRILNALLLAIIGLLLFKLCRKRVGTISAALLAVAWALTSPRPCQHSCSNLFTSNNLPWPSVFSTLILMVSLTLLNSIKAQEGSPRRQSLIFGATGFLLAIGSLARIQLIASFAFVMFLLLWKKGEERSRTEKYSFLLGGLISTLLSILLLIKFGIWQPFLNQCIFWSFHNYGKLPISVSTLVNILWYPGIALAFMGLWAFLSKATLTRNTVLKFLILVTPTALFLFAAFILNSDSKTSLGSQVRNGNFLVDVSSNVLNCLGYISAAYLLYQLMPKHVRSSNGQSSKIDSRAQRNPSYIASIGIAASALFQLYPLFDPLHLWWITPVLISGALVSSSRISALIRSKQSVARSILIGLTVSGIFQLAAAAESNRVPFHDIALQGMKSSPEEVKQLDATMQMLSKFGIPRQIKFLCSDGLYAAAGGKYLASDADFVDWGTTSSNSDQAEYRQIFVCNVKSSSIKDFQQIGWKLISATSSERGDGVNALFETIP